MNTGQWPVLDWQIWYIGGITYRSDSTKWEDLPKEDCLIILVHTTESTMIICGYDNYYQWGGYNDGENIIKDDIIKGAWISDQEFFDLKKEVEKL